MSDVSYLPAGLPIPVPEPDALSARFWQGLRENHLLVQCCGRCSRLQWGPEWICHRCHSFDMTWREVEPVGRIYSWERVWHPSHPALKAACPYLVVLVEISQRDSVRLIGNLLGDPHQIVEIGAAVTGVFEHHRDAVPAFSLLQWRTQ